MRRFGNLLQHPCTRYPHSAPGFDSPAQKVGSILIADDNRDQTDSLAMLFELTGHAVLTAYEGQRAFELAQVFRPRWLLLDLNKRSARYPAGRVNSVGLLMATIVLGCEAWYLHASPESWQTIVLTALCFSQLAHAMAIRSEWASSFELGLRSNLPLLGAVILTVLLQFAIVYIPVLNPVFKTVPLSGGELGICVAASVVVFGVVEVEKWTRRRLGARPE
jgi:cation transport ATPase-like protein